TLERGLVLGPYRVHPDDPQAGLGQGEGLRGHARAAVVGNGGALLANYGTVLKVTQPAGYLNLFSNAYSNLAVGSSQSIAFDIDRADDPALYLLGYGVIAEPDKRLVTVVEPPPPLAWVARCAW